MTKRIEEIRERAGLAARPGSAAGVYCFRLVEHDIPWLLAQLAAAHAEIARLRTAVNAIDNVLIKCDRGGGTDHWPGSLLVIRDIVHDAIASPAAAEGNPQQPATPESGA